MARTRVGIFTISGISTSFSVKLYPQAPDIPFAPQQNTLPSEDSATENSFPALISTRNNPLVVIASVNLLLGLVSSPEVPHS
jgi:hypothetical protein